MSAYGAIQRNVSSIFLPSSIWYPGSQKANISSNYVIVHHLTIATAQEHSGLVEYLYNVFQEVVKDGRTYPQEEVGTAESFQNYFFAADVFVAVKKVGSPTDEKAIEGSVCSVSLSLPEGIRWDEYIAGFYYVKPNYPGRSSHICNGGFVVPPTQQNFGYGSALAKSYVYYAPQLGYQASVFNLVYVNNIASVKLWERLNFTKIGRVPRAGRLRRPDGSGDEYVDAWVIYKSFLDLETSV